MSSDNLKKSILLLLISALCIFFASCSRAEEFEKGKTLATVYVATDTHLMSEDLFSADNEVYIKENFVSDGRIQECDYQLMEDLVAKVNEDRPDAVVFTGDISFNGEILSHEAFLSFLRRIDEGIKVLVIPGNHDFNMIGCRSYLGDTPMAAETIDGTGFCDMYESFGYGDALSRDEESLSYIAKISDGLWALMLDSTLCEFNEVMGFNVAGGGVSEKTMEWIRPWLKKAKEEGITVLAFSHHNLTAHNELFTDDYVMYNAEALASLYEEYGVKVNLSGHMHIQNIAKAGGVYDIAQGGFLDYGNRIGKIDVFDNCIEYSRIAIGDLMEYSIGAFCDEYMKKAASSYKERYGDKYEDVLFLASLLNAYYFDGDYVRINEQLKQRSEAVNLLKKKEKGTYFSTIMNVENKDQNYLLIK